MSASVERFVARVALVAAFVLFSLYSFTTPLFEASDEFWHYPLVQHLASGGGLPIQRIGQTDEQAPWRQEGSQPPLYYVLAALATAPIDASNWREVRRINPHSDMGRPTPDGNSNTVLHTSAEQFPWTHATLAMHVARLLSVALSTLTVMFTYLAAGEVFPRTLGTPSQPAPSVDPLAWVRLGSMAFVAGVPMFAFISGSVNNDNAAALFTTLGLWWALRLVSRGNLSMRSALIAGVISAAAALSKSSTLGLIGVFSLAVALTAIKLRLQSEAWLGKAVRFGGVFVAVVVALAGWWFVRNQLLYGDWLGWNAFLDAVGRRNPPASLAQLWSEREGFVWAYWGVFGALNVIMPPIVYMVLNGLAIVAFAGLLTGALREFLHPGEVSTSRSPRITLHRKVAYLLTDHSSFILCLAWISITFIALLRWTSLTPASQGRLLFPCIAVIAMSMAYGLYQLHRYLMFAAATGLLALTLVIPFAVIQPIYTKPPNTPTAQPANRLDVSFGNALDLLGYDTPPATTQPGKYVTIQLYWRVVKPMTHNYSVFVHLLNTEDVIVAQRDMYPGQGLIATSELPAGYAWHDRYAVQIPQLTPIDKELHWAVGIYDLQTGQRLTATKGLETDQGIVLGRTIFVTGSSRGTLLDYDNGITLEHYEVTPGVLTASQPITVTLHWRATRHVDTNYTISLQLLGDRSNKIAQNDSGPVQGNAPTTTWKVGKPITDTHVFQVASDAPPGVYRLLLVVYNPGNFMHLGAYGQDGIYIGTEVVLEDLRVK